MRITSNQYGSSLAYTSDTQQKNKSVITEKLAISETNNENQERNVDDSTSLVNVYKEIAKEYPEVTFRMSDFSNTKDGQWGYKGSFHQIGSNFSSLSQKSIEIDSSIVKRMETDDNFAEEVNYAIQMALADYSNFAQSATENGFSYMSASIEYGDDGNVTWAYTNSHSAASTDDELKKLYNQGDFEKVNFDKLENSLLDTYLKMTDEHLQKSRELGIKKSEQSESEEAKIVYYSSEAAQKEIAKILADRDI